jgi:transposase
MFLAQPSNELLEQAARWVDLKRWERRELAQELRRLGLSYREIADVIPVSKATLSGWCADIELTAEQAQRLSEKRPALAVRQRLGKERRMQARRERALIRSAAALEAASLLDDAQWTAGTVAYWAEGSKGKELCFTNSDPDMIRLFMVWVRRYLDVAHSDITIRLHLHTGQDEIERRRFWSRETGIPDHQFRAGFVKPEGTGHRKNHLYAGTAVIRIARSGALLQRVLGWIDALRSTTAPLG